MIEKSETELLETPNFGVISLNEINSKLSALGLRFNMKEGQQSFDPKEISVQQKSFLKQNVENLGFSVRSLKCFNSMGIYTIADLIQRSESELMIRKNFGRKSLGEVISILSELGLCLGTVLPEELNLEIEKSRGKLSYCQELCMKKNKFFLNEFL